MMTPSLPHNAVPLTVPDDEAIIAECIRRGGHQCHLLWGRHEYKFRFLGELRELDNLTVYRSPLAMLRQAETVLGVLSQAALRAAHRGLQAARRGDSLAWRVMVQLAQAWRGLRRLRPGARHRGGSG